MFVTFDCSQQGVWAVGQAKRERIPGRDKRPNGRGEDITSVHMLRGDVESA